MTPKNHGILYELDAFIEDQLDNSNLSIVSVCEHLGLSRASLHRVLTKNNLQSLSLYIRQKRLSKAKELLKNTDLRISEVADAVGINSPQNFSKYFNEAYSISPSNYKNKVKSVESNSEVYTIAVLPFTNLSNNQEQEYFSDGITDELTNVLSRISSMKVVGRSSSFSFKGKNDDIRNIGSSLGADYILEGSVRRSENKLRINAQLTNSKDGFQIWSSRYDREMQDVFDIQDEISLAILEEIEIKLLGKSTTNKLKRGVSNPEAYELFLKGRYHFNKFAGPVEYEKSIEFYKQAIELEPNYAAAYAGIASSYLNLWFYRFLDPAIGLREIREATSRALEIDDENPESLLALARMQLLIDWDFVAAEKTFLRAISFGSQLADLHGQYALLLSLRERKEEALNQFSIAIKIDSLSLFNNFYGGYIYWLCGETEKAMNIGRKLVELEPESWAGHAILGLNLFKKKEVFQAISELEIAKSTNYSGFTLSALGTIYGLNGQISEANFILAEMEELKKTKPVSNYDFGIVHSSLGNIDISSHYFETAIKAHEPSMLFFKFIIRDWLDEFKKDIRYTRLLDLLP